MMRMALTKFSGFLVLLAYLLSAATSAVRAEADHAGIARASLTEVIRPGYTALGDATGALSGKIGTLCKDPSDAALKDARDAFAATVDATTPSITRLRKSRSNCIRRLPRASSSSATRSLPSRSARRPP
jgi:predicted lipoprotein